MFDMFDRLYEYVTSAFGSTDDEPAGESDARFVPSPLDASVRAGHGAPDDEIERELSDTAERARELEEARGRK